MSDELVDAVVGWLPHIPGIGGLGLGALAFFRAGRAVGKAEHLVEEIGQLKGRVEKSEAAHSVLEVKFAGLPQREEIRTMIAESREETRDLIGEVREDIRALSRGG